MKVCYRCKENKPKEQFGASNQKKDGLHCWCKPCHQLWSREYRKKNGERLRESEAAWRQANKEKINANARIYMSGYRKKNRAKFLEKDRIYRSKHPKAVALAAKQWQSDNMGKVNAATARRRAEQAQRTPAWADLEAIKFFYECCPKGCHVDHIIPLRGKNISGLHIETNLQWLPALDNIRKSNQWSAEA